jgi:hypothetical protein
MLRGLIVSALLSAIPAAAALQAPSLSVLHIKIFLLDAARRPTPVPRHALLISDNPATSTPRRVVTALDGTIDVRLRPGNYTVESDAPFAFDGKAYEWRRVIDMVAGRDLTLELTVANAEIGTAATAPPPPDAPVESGLSSMLIKWQDSVLALWTPTTHASGFVIDPAGLVATSQRVIAGATSVEVQVTPEVKVAGNVLVADAGRDVAVLWIDPAAVAAVRPVPLGCAAKPAVAVGQEIFTIGVPLRLQKGPAFGVISSVDSRALASDLVLPGGSAGGPVFAGGGSVVGLTSSGEDKDVQGRLSARVVRVDAVCEAVAAAEQKMNESQSRPSAAKLPVEPARAFPEEALKEAAQRRVGSLNPFQTTSNDFEISFITPVMTYGEAYLAEQAASRDRARGGRGGGAGVPPRAQLDFGNWSEYVSEFPPVLLVRVTPKMVEGFWTKVARGAAQTQGVALPEFKRFRSGFARLRAFCGDAEVTPIHPFKLEHRVSETESIYEGLYVFDPGALAPSCSSVKLTMFSEKEPNKADTRVVEPRIIQQIWQDFAGYR